MDLRRLIQTSLAHPLRPEFSLAALFVGATIEPDADAEAITTALGIEAISSGSISEPELKRVLAWTLLERFDVFDMNERAFRSYINEIGIDVGYLDSAVRGNNIVIEMGAPRTTSLMDILDNAIGACVGLYNMPSRPQAAAAANLPKTEVLSVIVPYGVVVCGSQLGLDRVLQLGLFENLFRLLK